MKKYLIVLATLLMISCSELFLAVPNMVVRPSFRIEVGDIVTIKHKKTGEYVKESNKNVTSQSTEFRVEMSSVLDSKAYWRILGPVSASKTVSLSGEISDKTVFAFQNFVSGYYLFTGVLDDKSQPPVYTAITRKYILQPDIFYNHRVDLLSKYSLLLKDASFFLDSLQEAAKVPDENKFYAFPKKGQSFGDFHFSAKAYTGSYPSQDFPDSEFVIDKIKLTQSSFNEKVVEHLQRVGGAASLGNPVRDFLFAALDIMKDNNSLSLSTSIKDLIYSRVKLYPKAFFDVARSKDMRNASLASQVSALFSDALLATDLILANAALLTTSVTKPKFEVINGMFRGIDNQVNVLKSPPARPANEPLHYGDYVFIQNSYTYEYLTIDGGNSDDPVATSKNKEDRHWWYIVPPTDADKGKVLRAGDKFKLKHNGSGNNILSCGSGLVSLKIDIVDAGVIYPVKSDRLGSSAYWKIMSTPETGKDLQLVWALSGGALDLPLAAASTNFTQEVTGMTTPMRNVYVAPKSTFAYNQWYFSMAYSAEDSEISRLNAVLTAISKQSVADVLAKMPSYFVVDYFDAESTTLGTSLVNKVKKAVNKSSKDSLTKTIDFLEGAQKSPYLKQNWTIYANDVKALKADLATLGTASQPVPTSTVTDALRYGDKVVIVSPDGASHMFANKDQMNSTKTLYWGHRRTSPITVDNEFIIYAEDGRESNYNQGAPIQSGAVIRLFHPVLGVYGVYSGGRLYFEGKSSSNANWIIADSGGKAGSLSLSSSFNLQHVSTKRFLQVDQSQSYNYYLISTLQSSADKFRMKISNLKVSEPAPVPAPTPTITDALKYGDKVVIISPDGKSHMFANKDAMNSTKTLYWGHRRTSPITVDNEFIIYAEHGRESTYNQGKPIQNGATIRLFHPALQVYAIYSGGRVYFEGKSSSNANWKITDSEEKAGDLSLSRLFNLQHVDTNRVLEVDSSQANNYALVNTQIRYADDFSINLSNLKTSEPAPATESAPTPTVKDPLKYGDKVVIISPDGRSYMFANKDQTNSTKTLYWGHRRTSPITVDNEFIIYPEHGRGSNYNQGKPIQSGATIRLFHPVLGVYGIYSGGRLYFEGSSSSNANWNITDSGNRDGELSLSRSFVLTHVTSKRVLQIDTSQAYNYLLVTTRQSSADNFKMKLSDLKSPVSEPTPAPAPAPEPTSAPEPAPTTTVNDPLKYGDRVVIISPDGKSYMFANKDQMDSTKKLYWGHRRTSPINFENEFIIHPKHGRTANFDNGNPVESGATIRLFHPILGVYGVYSGGRLYFDATSSSNANWTITDSGGRSGALSLSRSFNLRHVDMNRVLQVDTSQAYNYSLGSTSQSSADKFTMKLSNMEESVPPVTDPLKYGDKVVIISPDGKSYMFANKDQMDSTKKLYCGHRRTNPIAVENEFIIYPKHGRAPNYDKGKPVESGELIRLFHPVLGVYGVYSGGRLYFGASSSSSANWSIIDSEGRPGPLSLSRLFNFRHMETNRVLQVDSSQANNYFLGNTSQSSADKFKIKLSSLEPTPVGPDPKQVEADEAHKMATDAMNNLKTKPDMLNAIDLINKAKALPLLAKNIPTYDKWLADINERIKVWDLGVVLNTLVAQDPAKGIKGLPPHFGTSAISQYNTDQAHKVVMKVVTARGTTSELSRPDVVAFLQQAQESNLLKPYHAEYAKLVTTIQQEIVQEKEKAAADKAARDQADQAHKNATEAMQNIKNKQDMLNAIDLINKAKELPLLAENIPTYNKWLADLDMRIKVWDVNNKLNWLVKQDAATGIKVLPQYLGTEFVSPWGTQQAHKVMMKVVSARGTAPDLSRTKVIALLQEAQKSNLLQPHHAEYADLEKTIKSEQLKIEGTASLNKILTSLQGQSAQEIRTQLPKQFGANQYDATSTKLGHQLVEKGVGGRDKNNAAELKQVVTFLQASQKAEFLKEYWSTYGGWAKVVQGELAVLSSVNEFNIILTALLKKSPQEIVTELPKHFEAKQYNAQSTKLGHDLIVKAIGSRDKSNAGALQKMIGLLTAAQQADFLKSYQKTYISWVETIQGELDLINSTEKLNAQIKKANSESGFATKTQALLDIINSLGKTPINEVSQQLMAAGVNDLIQKIESQQTSAGVNNLNLLLGLLAAANNSQLLTAAEKEKIPPAQKKIQDSFVEIYITKGSFGSVLQRLRYIVTAADKTGEPLSSLNNLLVTTGFTKLYDLIPSLTAEQLTELTEVTKTVFVPSKVLTSVQKSYVEKTLIPALNKQANDRSAEQLNTALRDFEGQNVGAIITNMTPLLDEKIFNNQTTVIAHELIKKVVSGRNKKNEASLQATLEFLNKANQSPYLVSQKATYDSWSQVLKKEKAALLAIEELNEKIKVINGMEDIAKQAKAFNDLLIESKDASFNAITQQRFGAGINFLVSSIPSLVTPQGGSVLQAIAAALKIAASSPLVDEKGKATALSGQELVQDALGAIAIQSGELAAVMQKMQSLLAQQELNEIEDKTISFALDRISGLLSGLSESQLASISTMMKEKILLSDNLSVANKGAVEKLIKEIDVLLNRLNKEEAIASFNKTLAPLIQRSGEEIMEQLTPLFKTTLFNEQSTQLGHAAVQKVYQERNASDIEQLAQVATFLKRAASSPYLASKSSEYEGWVVTIENSIQQYRQQQDQVKSQAVQTLELGLQALSNDQDKANMLYTLNKVLYDTTQSKIYPEMQQVVASYITDQLMPQVKGLGEQELISLQQTIIPVLQRSTLLADKEKGLLINGLVQEVEKALEAVNENRIEQQAAVNAFDTRINSIEQESLVQKLDSYNKEMSNVGVGSVYEPMRVRFAQSLRSHLIPLISSFSQQELALMEERGFVTALESTDLLAPEQRAELSTQVLAAMSERQNILAQTEQQEDVGKQAIVDNFKNVLNEVDTVDSLQGKLRELISIMEDPLLGAIYSEMQGALFEKLMSLVPYIPNASGEDKEIAQIFIEAMLPPTRLLTQEQKDNVSRAFALILSQDQQGVSQEEGTTQVDGQGEVSQPEEPSTVTTMPQESGTTTDQSGQQSTTEIIDQGDQLVDQPVEEVIDEPVVETINEPVQEVVDSPSSRVISDRSRTQYTRSRTSPQQSSERIRSARGRETTAQSASTRQVARTVTQGTTGRTITGPRQAVRNQDVQQKSSRIDQYQQTTRDTELTTRQSGRTGTTATTRSLKGAQRSSSTRRAR